MTTYDLFPDTLTDFPESTSSLAASPANPPASPATEADPETAAGYGPSSSKLFRHLAPDGSWQKTFSASLALNLTGLTGSAGHFETSVTSHGRSFSPLTTWVRHTSDDVCGLLPTPRTLWPTPTAGDANSSGSRNTPGSKAHYGVSLTDAIRQDGGTGRQPFATPTASTAKGGLPQHSKGKRDLRLEYSTPTANDAKNNNAPSQRERNSEALNVQIGGSLNPAWVCWLMGFPTDWTVVGGFKSRKAFRASPPKSRTASTSYEHSETP